MWSCCGQLRSWVLAAMVLSVPAWMDEAGAAEPDPYLKELEEEAGKVDAGKSGDGKPSGSVDPGKPGASRPKFEAELKERYAGSYVFYKKMPNRAQEEVFEEYKKGASVDEIRRKIVARFLETAK